MRQRRRPDRPARPRRRHAPRRTSNPPSPSSSPPTWAKRAKATCAACVTSSIRSQPLRPAHRRCHRARRRWLLRRRHPSPRQPPLPHHRHRPRRPRLDRRRRAQPHPHPRPRPACESRPVFRSTPPPNPQPRTTLNIGHISGGTSINSIPASASAWLDLRSTDPPNSTPPKSRSASRSSSGSPTPRRLQPKISPVPHPPSSRSRPSATAPAARSRRLPAAHHPPRRRPSPQPAHRTRPRLHRRQHPALPRHSCHRHRRRRSRRRHPHPAGVARSHRPQRRPPPHPAHPARYRPPRRPESGERLMTSAPLKRLKIETPPPQISASNHRHIHPREWPLAPSDYTQLNIPAALARTSRTQPAQPGPLARMRIDLHHGHTQANPARSLRTHPQSPPYRDLRAAGHALRRHPRRLHPHPLGQRQGADRRLLRRAPAHHSQPGHPVQRLLAHRQGRRPRGRQHQHRHPAQAVRHPPPGPQRGRCRQPNPGDNGNDQGSSQGDMQDFFNRFFGGQGGHGRR
jgi:hypothetical protein